MKTSKVVRLGGALAVISLLALGANATIVYNGTVAYDNPAITGNRNADINLGMDFTVNTPGWVTAMGAFDDQQNGFAGTVDVALYYSSGANAGTQVAGTLVSFTGLGGSWTLAGGSQFQDITDVALGIGSYRVVAHYTSIDLFASTYATPYDVSHPWTFGGGPYLTHNNSWFTQPATSLGYPVTGHPYPQPSFAAGTFSFTPVPEAETFGAAAVGLLGLVYLVRQVRIRRKIALA